MGVQWTPASLTAILYRHSAGVLRFGDEHYLLSIFRVVRLTSTTATARILEAADILHRYENS
jgi:hypothetical protein